MDRLKSKVIINQLLETQLLQPLSENAQQEASGGAIYSQPEWKYISIRRY